MQGPKLKTVEVVVMVMIEGKPTRHLRGHQLKVEGHRREELKKVVWWFKTNPKRESSSASASAENLETENTCELLRLLRLSPEGATAAFSLFFIFLSLTSQFVSKQSRWQATNQTKSQQQPQQHLLHCRSDSHPTLCGICHHQSCYQPTTNKERRHQRVLRLISSQNSKYLHG